MSKNIDEALLNFGRAIIKINSEQFFSKDSAQDVEDEHQKAKQAILADLLSVMPEKIEPKPEDYDMFGDYNHTIRSYNQAIDDVTAAIKNYIKGE